MGRLTEKVFGSAQIIKCGNDLCSETCEEYTCKTCPISQAIDKLAEYEDAEEQGLIIRLPCKVGDTVYEIQPLTNRITERIIKSIVICNAPNLTIMYKSGYDYSILHEDFEKTIFLTKEEAEQALKQMEGVRV